MTDEELLGLYKPVYDYLDAFGIFEVRNLARAFGVKKPTYGRKHDLIMRLIGVACGDVPAGLRAKKGARVKEMCIRDRNRGISASISAVSAG